MLSRIEQPINERASMSPRYTKRLRRELQKGKYILPNGEL
jgi:hypothetical protein